MKTILVLFAAVLLLLTAYAVDNKKDKTAKSITIQVAQSTQTIKNVLFLLI